ncbi:MAG: SRPBCC family protein [Phycisphaerae bacterium]|nr:SRPBCC family protein [Gemmatimonadaceae bacterium]
MALLVSIVAAVLVGGMATPRHHVVSRAILLRAAPEAVWHLVRDVAGYPEWRDDIYSVSVASSSDGQLHWTEVGRQRSVSYLATMDAPPERFSRKITDDDLGYSAEWQFVISAIDTGSRVTVTETGEVGNPIFRFFGTHFIGYTSGIDAFLTELALHLGERAKPQPGAP